MGIIINPGTGEVKEATAEHAINNIKHFITDCGVDGVEFKRISKQDYGEGRYAFILWKDTRSYEIQMPGKPLEEVRFMNNDNQNIWHFPRLYVDGSSWVWKYALLSEDDFREPESD
jgi:hypothetical protein